MTRDEAKAKGLEVYPAWRGCKLTGHGNMRRTSSNKCIACLKAEADLKGKLKASVMEDLRAQAMKEAKRLLQKEAKAILAAARSEAAEILKAARKEASNKAAMLEKAKATREAKKAAKAAKEAAEGLGTGEPGEAHSGAFEGSVGSDEAAPWN